MGTTHGKRILRGNIMEHYRCHEVYITDTRHTRMCSLVFFKHKYLTMPSLTPANALIRAADDLTTALAGVIPPPSMTTDAIAQLINIFKMQAEKMKDEATLQRVLRENAQAERVRNKTVVAPFSPQTTATNTYPPLEIEEYPKMDVGTPQGTPVSYPEDNSTSSQPADNTRHQRKVRTITQDYLFHLMDTSFLPGQHYSPANKPVHGCIPCNSYVTLPTRS